MALAEILRAFAGTLEIFSLEEIAEIDTSQLPLMPSPEQWDLIYADLLAPAESDDELIPLEQISFTAGLPIWVPWSRLQECFWCQGLIAWCAACGPGGCGDDEHPLCEECFDPMEAGLPPETELAMLLAGLEPWHPPTKLGYQLALFELKEEA